MLIQTAQEAVNTPGIIISAGVVTAVLGTAGLWIKEYYRTKRLKKNGNSNGKAPGKAEVCIERGQKLAVMDEKFKNIEGDIGEIKSDVKKLLLRVPEKN